MPAVAALIAFLVLQLCLLVPWWRWLAARAPRLGVAERLLCAAVLYVAQVIGLSLLLGWLGVLAPAPLLALNIGAAAALLLAARRRAPAPCRATRVARWRRGAGTALVGALGALLALALALVVARDALAPSPGWDGLMYHLPMSALMMQTQRLDFPPVHNPLIATYPKSGEIWAHWMLACVGHDRWLGLAQMPFLALAVLALYVAARRLNARPAAAAAGALLLPFAPVVLAQVGSAYTDVVGASLLLAALALLLVARTEASAPVALAFGAALGLLIGTKFSAAAWGAVVFGAFALTTWRAHGRRALAALGLAAGLALLLGGDAYLRNWRQHGNPIYPFRTTVFGVTWPGPRASNEVYGVRETRDVAPLTRLARSWSAVGVVSHSTLYGGFGITWPFLLALSLGSLALAARERDATRLGLFALFALLFAITPLNFRVRFVIFLLGLGCLSFSHLLDRAGRRGGALLGAAALGIAAYTTWQFWHATLAVPWRDAAAWHARPDPCASTDPPAFRSAYAWLRRHAPVGGTILLLRSADAILPYCLWRPDIANRVAFVDADSPAALRQLAARHPDAILFVPRRAAAHAHLAADAAAWQTLFADAHVTLARRLAAGVPPRFQ